MVNIGIIGTGYWGPNVLRSFLNIENCRVKWICDRKEGRLKYVQERFKEHLNGIKLTRDYKELLNDPQLDAISIVTPVETHFNLALEAIKREKHVYLEKPFVLDVKESLILGELSEKKNLKLCVGNLFEYHPAIEVIRDEINSPSFGKIYYYQTNRVNLRPPKTTVNVIWDLASHDFSIVNYLQGNEPLAIQAFGTGYVNTQLIDVAFIKVWYPDDVFAQIHVSWHSPNKTRRLCLYGDRHSIYFDDILLEDKVKIFDQGIDTRIGVKDNEVKELVYKPGEVRTPQLPSHQPLQKECQYFINSILNGDGLRNDWKDGYRVVKMIQLANQSIEQKGRILAYE